LPTTSDEQLQTTGNTAIQRRVERLRAGDDGGVIARLPSGWAVMGDPQVIDGYCLLLPDPVVPHLNALPVGEREQFLADMARLGDAVLAVTGALRINYAIFGNLEPALHAHVFPRRAHEPEALRTAHPWGWDWAHAPRYSGETHGSLLNAIRQRLVEGAARAPDIARHEVSGHAGGALNHLDLTVRDLDRSTAFYEWLLPHIGFVREPDCTEGPLWQGESFQLGLQGASSTGAARLHDRYSPGLHHLAFDAPSRAAVDRLHDVLVERGVPIFDAPAEYPVYEPGYYAVFFADPDGMKLEYVHRSSQGAEGAS
jgi:diadenosine tetraphosphate (Ap4A) HIT family hydrolase/catechol 2,3-dioxygenase-like lactoylglutathione lyase family enzyme